MFVRFDVLKNIFKKFQMKIYLDWLVKITLICYVMILEDTNVLRHHYSRSKQSYEADMGGSLNIINYFFLKKDDDYSHSPIIISVTGWRHAREYESGTTQRLSYHSWLLTRSPRIFPASQARHSTTTIQNFQLRTNQTPNGTVS